MRTVVVMLVALGMVVPASAPTPTPMTELANMMGILGGCVKACGARTATLPHPGEQGARCSWPVYSGRTDDS